MKKLTLKKTTLSRLNESTLAKVKGGYPFLDHHINTDPDYCVVGETGRCAVTPTFKDCATDGCRIPESDVAIC
jgi:hypothetical protein